MQANKHDYSFATVISKSFNIALNDFAYAVTFLFHIKSKILFTLAMTLTTKMVSTINVKRVRLLISAVKLTTKLTQTVDARYIKVVYIMRQRMKAVSTITSYTPMTFVSKARQKVVSVIDNGITSVLVTPTLAKFFT